MSPQSLGNTLIIANPAAHSGRGETAAIYVTRFFSSFNSIASSCSVQLTEREGDACRMAEDSVEYETVIALGGDGIIHEVANGLMKLPEPARPRLGVIPVGTGNDFARTLGMRKNDPERAMSELLGGEERRLDIGRVNDTYFVQSLSFGLDAAIAQDTTRRRSSLGLQHGASLYLTSGIRMLALDQYGWPYHARVEGDEGEETLEGMGVAFAIQNGKTYGGGFKICPGAVPNDGFLDLCVSLEKPSRMHSLMLFGLIRMGRHTRSKKLLLRKIRHIEVEFVGKEQPPCQVDGEAFLSERYTIDVIPQALRVIVPPDCKW